MIRRLLAIGLGRVFILLIILVYVFLFFAEPSLANQSVLAFWRLLLNIIPVLALVFVIMFLANLVLQAETTVKYLGEKSGLKGWAVAVFGGILSTGPIYMWYPLLSDLKEKGMKDSLIATFLYNRAVKIPLMPMMIYYFGWMFLIILTIYMLIFSIINGVIVGKISR